MDLIGGFSSANVGEVSGFSSTSLSESDCGDSVQVDVNNIELGLPVVDEVNISGDFNVSVRREVGVDSSGEDSVELLESSDEGGVSALAVGVLNRCVDEPSGGGVSIEDALSKELSSPDSLLVSSIEGRELDVSDTPSESRVLDVVLKGDGEGGVLADGSELEGDLVIVIRADLGFPLGDDLSGVHFLSVDLECDVVSLSPSTDEINGSEDTNSFVGGDVLKSVAQNGAVGELGSGEDSSVGAGSQEQSVSRDIFVQFPAEQGVLLELVVCELIVASEGNGSELSEG